MVKYMSLNKRKLIFFLIKGTPWKDGIVGLEVDKLFLNVLPM